MSLFQSAMEFLKLGQLSLLQSTIELSQIETAQFKCDGQLLHIITKSCNSFFLYGLLQIATGITKCDGFTTNWDNKRFLTR